MDLSLKRVILFTKRMPEMVAFYRDVLGLKLSTNEKGWKEFEAGGCGLALHSGSSVVGTKPPKLVFYARDVTAARKKVLGRGARLGKVNSASGLYFCDGKDPDGNAFQISSRT